MPTARYAAITSACAEAFAALSVDNADSTLWIVKERQPIFRTDSSAGAKPADGYAEYWIGGGERDRTDDPLLAKQVLSQLSYTPAKICIVNLVRS